MRGLRLFVFTPALRPWLTPHPNVSAVTTFVRARSSAAPKRRKVEHRPNERVRAHLTTGDKPLLRLKTTTVKPLEFSDITPYLSSRVMNWLRQTHVQHRMVNFGVPRDEVIPALKAFALALRDDTVFKTLDYDHAHMDRLAHDLANARFIGPIDVTLTRLFYEWAAHPDVQPVLEKVISTPTIYTIRELFRAADMSNPAADFPIPRSEPRRKVIMHVGPTNSGKTHNALRALAAARTGLYAGPLRLLAHEIWERLNKGQIVPAGVDPDADAEPDEDTNMDGALDSQGRPVVQKDGNSKYVRVCNLITGEEQKLVDENAGLVSCTVEMSNLVKQFDVAVVDEIQLLADPERGGSWTSAVLGLNAKELHLCGEEAAVPLVQSMLRDTADELIVNRYQRLTPLRVAEESLDGDFSKVQKGDCIVTFSRSGIFDVKNRIEKSTKLKCAVAYGRLPPEIRNEQARLFNDPNSGYDVIVGSDAIGMGLNLKIKRVIFEAVRKFDGQQERLLSVSQIKQIAGRAGRYGLHGEDESGGIVTTLLEPDLKVVRDALKMPPEPIRLARRSGAYENHAEILQALPPSTSTSIELEVCKYVSKMHPSYEFQEVSKAMDAMDYIDRVVGRLILADRLMMQNAPIPWRDEPAVECIGRFMQIYQEKIRVPLTTSLSNSGLLDKANDVLECMKFEDPSAASIKSLNILETLHKVVVVYLWLSYRNQIAFYDREKAVELKDHAERGMAWILGSLSLRNRSKYVRVSSIPAVNSELLNETPLMRVEPRGNRQLRAP